MRSNRPQCGKEGVQALQLAEAAVRDARVGNASLAKRQARTALALTLSKRREEDSRLCKRRLSRAIGATCAVETGPSLALFGRDAQGQDRVFSGSGAMPTRHRHSEASTT